MLLSLLIAPLAFAEVGAITRSTAGAGHAALEATDSPQLNPGSLPFLRGYLFSATTSQTSEKLAKDFAGQKKSGTEFGLRLTDRMKDTVVPTSLVYDQTRYERVEGFLTPQPDDIKDFRLLFGNYIGRSVGLGFGVRYTENFKDSERFNQWNAQMGLLWAPSLNFAFSYSVENPTISHVSQLSADKRLLPRTSFGASYNFGPTVRAKADVQTGSNHSFALPNASAGFETFLNRWLVMRFGWGRDFETRQTRSGYGLGFIGPKFSVHYGFLKASASAEKLDDPSFVALNEQSYHSVDLTISIW